MSTVAGAACTVKTRSEFASNVEISAPPALKMPVSYDPRGLRVTVGSASAAGAARRASKPIVRVIVSCPLCYAVSRHYGAVRHFRQTDGSCLSHIETLRDRKVSHCIVDDVWI